MTDIDFKISFPALSSAPYANEAALLSSNPECQSPSLVERSFTVRHIVRDAQGVGPQLERGFHKALSLVMSAEDMSDLPAELSAAWLLHGDEGVEEAFDLIEFLCDPFSGEGLGRYGVLNSTDSFRNLSSRLWFVVRDLKHRSHFKLRDERLHRYIACMCGQRVQSVGVGNWRWSCGIIKFCTCCSSQEYLAKQRRMIGSAVEAGGVPYAVTLGIAPMPEVEGFRCLSQAVGRLKERIYGFHRSADGTSPARAVLHLRMLWELGSVGGDWVQHLHGVANLDESMDHSSACAWLVENWKDAVRDISGLDGASAEVVPIHGEDLVPDPSVYVRAMNWIGYCCKSGPFAGGLGDRYSLGDKELSRRIYEGELFREKLGKARTEFSGTFGRAAARCP